MSEEDEDLGQMAWPGFVDILSSVIIMFVFFVMVVASALYFHIIIFKSKVLSEISDSVSAQARMEELSTTNRTLSKKIEELTQNLKVLEEINEDNEVQLFKEDSGFAESEDQKIVTDESNRTITIFFGKDSISVTKDSQLQINAAIAKYSEQFSADNTKVTITSNKNPDTVNDVISRRLAVARMLNVRNSFLVSDIPTEQVDAKMVAQDKVEDSYNWVKIKFDKQ